MITTKRLLPYVMLFFLGSSIAYPETKWYFEGEGRDVRTYDVKNGKKKFVYSNVEGPSDVIINKSRGTIEDAEFYVNNRIRDKNLFIKKLSKTPDYYTALYNWRYFDSEKAEKTAKRYIAEGRLKKNHKDFFKRACSKWPFVKFYSQVCSKEYYPIDSRLSYLVFTIENRFEDGKGECGEIGSTQLMPKTARDGSIKWSKSDYWIEGYGVEHPINNLLGGIQHLISCCKYAGCKKSLEEMTEDELKLIYTCYVSGKGEYTNNDYWIRNLADSVNYLYIISLADKSTANGTLINHEGKTKLENLKGQNKKIIKKE